MLRDIIPLIPFPLIKLPKERQNLFFLIKAMRVFRGLEKLNVPEIMKSVKEHYKLQLIELGASNPGLADDPTIDNNKMGHIIFISMALRTFKLILLIFNVSYFIGMSWLILCINIYTERHNVNYEDMMDNYFEPEEVYSFLEYYNMPYYSRQE